MDQKPAVRRPHIVKLTAYLPHFSVLAHGTKSERQGLLSGASPDFIKTASWLTQYMDPSDVEQISKDASLNNMLNLISSKHSDKKMLKLRELATDPQTGGDLGEVMSQIGKTALQLAPTLAPLLLAAI